jgi:Leucine Rich repeat
MDGMTDDQMRDSFKEMDGMWREVDRIMSSGEAELDLTNRALAGQGAVEVVRNFRNGASGKAQAVQRLSLSRNEIGDKGARAVAEFLRCNTCALEVVDLSDNKIGREGIDALAVALRYNTTLKELILNDNPGIHDDDALVGTGEIFSAIFANTTLEKIGVHTEPSLTFLGAHLVQKRFDNVLCDTEGRRDGRERFLLEAKEEWCAELERVLRSGEDMLNLKNMYLGDADVARVAEMLSGTGGGQVKKLMLSANRIGEAGLLALERLLESTGCVLEHVGFNEVGSEFIKRVAGALKRQHLGEAVTGVRAGHHRFGSQRTAHWRHYVQRNA